MSNIEFLQWKNKNRLAKIHQLKRENRVLASRRKSLMNRIIDITFLLDVTRTRITISYVLVINRISEQIGKNSAKIMRLRTLIKQGKTI